LQLSMGRVMTNLLCKLYSYELQFVEHAKLKDARELLYEKFRICGMCSHVLVVFLRQIVIPRGPLN